jgi:hypothetical protein
MICQTHTVPSINTLEIMTDKHPLRNVTPEMLREAQLKTELGALVTSSYSGAYGLITQMYQVMFDKALKQSVTVNKIKIVKFGNIRQDEKGNLVFENFVFEPLEKNYNYKDIFKSLISYIEKEMAKY